MAPIKNASQVQCRNCGSSNQPGSPHCNSCGAPFLDSTTSSVAQVQSAPQIAPTVPPALVSDPVVRFSTDGQDRALVKQTYERAKSILTQDEAIEYIATAKGGLGHAPDCAVATNKRVMLFRKKALGKVDLDDCWWRDVGAASLIDGKNGVTLKLDAIQGWHMNIESLPKAQADHLYGMAFNYADRLQGQGSTGSLGFAGNQPVAVPAQPSLLTPRLAGNPPSLPNLGAAPLIATGTLSNAANTMDSQPLQAAQAPATPFIPTPESVLQSILQNSALADLEEHGVPTRPMQWSAAAFQAPAMFDIQPVVLTGSNPPAPAYIPPSTDTEPQMRPLPPLTTLEKIAVFTPASGPLSLDSTPRLHLDSAPAAPVVPTTPSTPAPSSTPKPNTNSMPLSSMPLRDSGVFQSAPFLDAASLLGKWSDSAGLPSLDLDDEPYPQLDDFLSAVEAGEIEVDSEPVSLSETQDDWLAQLPQLPELPEMPEVAELSEISEQPRVASPTGPIALSMISTNAEVEDFTPIEVDEQAAVQEAPDEAEVSYATWSEPEPEPVAEPEPMPVPVAAAPEPVVELAPVDEVQAEPVSEVATPEMSAINFDDALQSGPLFDPSASSLRPTAPMGAEDYMLPMPGSTASGPLLAAAGEMDDALESMYRNTSPMSTQRLDYDAHPEDADLATRINLTLHNTPPNQMLPTRGSGGTQRSNTDELKASRPAGSRPSGSSRAKADDPIAKMKQLKALLDAGLITEEDYTSKKADILARI